MLNDQRLEEEYLDVLQNIEAEIAQVYQEHPRLTDWDVLDAVEALIRHYTAEARHKPPPTIRLSDLAQRVFNAAEAICEWRLGRKQLFTEDDQPADLEIEPITATEIIACLKRIRKSIRFWDKKGGRQGYLDYVSEFIY